MLEMYSFLILNGIGVGLIYFLLSVGLTLVFSLVGFINFAHGALYLLGAYFAYTLSSIGIGFWPSLILAPLGVALVGVVVERLLLRHTYRLAHDAQILLTFAITIIVTEMALVLWGPVGKNLPVPDALSDIVPILSFYYPVYRLFIIAVALFIALVLWLVIEKTRIGSALRAGSQSAEMVELLGINVYLAFTLTFALSAFLAGLAGVLAAPLRGAELSMGAEALGVAFVVTVVGGLGSFSGALWGSILVGIVQTLMASLWPEGAKLAIYMFMTGVLLVRPRGLFGRA